MGLLSCAIIVAMSTPFSFASLRGVVFVKALGTSIGGARAVVEPSEFDGDGDGFRVGRDGKDNVPVAPKRVVEAVKKAGRVSDLLKPSDDLFEVRKSGRAWKPLLFEHMPDDMKRDLKQLHNDIGEYMHAKGEAWKKVEIELVKKYAKPGENIFMIGGTGAVNDEVYKRIPREEIDKHAELFNNWLINDAYGVEFPKAKDLNKRIYDFDKKYHNFVKDAFERERQKAVDAGDGAKFDRAFSKFKKSIDNENNFAFARKFMSGDNANGLVPKAYLQGYMGEKWVPNQLDIADEEAKKLMDNPDKRIVAYVDAGMIAGILDDGRMKNFFEAKRNIFQDAKDRDYAKWDANQRKAAYVDGRLDGEQLFAGLPAGGFPAKGRPIYALMMPDGLRAPEGLDGGDLDYGNVGIVMKHSVEERSKFTAGDSLNWAFLGSSPVNDPSGMSMIAAKSGLGFSAEDRRKSAAGPVKSNFEYIEAQIMGGVSVNDISYLTVKDDAVLPDEIKTRLKDMGIPVVVHSSGDIYKEPAELASKAGKQSDSYVLFATYGNRRLYVPSDKPEDGDYHGMISVDNGKRRRVENVMSLMKFGNWELV